MSHTEQGKDTEAQLSPVNPLPHIGIKELRLLSDEDLNEICRESGDFKDYVNRVYEAARGKVDE